MFIKIKTVKTIHNLIAILSMALLFSTLPVNAAEGPAEGVDGPDTSHDTYRSDYGHQVERIEEPFRKQCLDRCGIYYNMTKIHCVGSSDPVACLDNDREELGICRQGCDN